MKIDRVHKIDRLKNSIDKRKSREEDEFINTLEKEKKKLQKSVDKLERKSREWKI